MRIKKHEDTSVSLHPLSFSQAIAKAAHAPKRKDSQAEGSGSTMSAADRLTCPTKAAKRPASEIFRRLNR